MISINPSASTFAAICIVLLSCAALVQTSPSPQDATAFALVYGYPLLAWEQLAVPMVTVNPVNAFNHARQLQTASSHYVVKPNVDTVYSVMIWDVSHDDVVLTIPPIPKDQFALFSFYDMYGNNFANLGSDNFDEAGDYRLVRRQNGTSFYGFQAANDASSGTRGTIQSPTAYGSVFIRWLVNATNLDAIHGYQDATKTKNVTLSSPPSGVPRLSSLLFAPLNATTPAGGVLSLLAQYAAIDGPEIASDTEVVNANLAAAGLVNGVYTPAISVNIDAANKTALQQADKEFEAAQTTLGNG